jgi:hypothetical protein
MLRAYNEKPVAEEDIQTWLTRVYADSAAWRERFQTTLIAFRNYVIASLHAFESADAGLTNLFRALLDECAVLPLELDDEYQSLKQERPVEAAALTVSLTWGQYKMLERRRLAWPAGGDQLFITAALYDPHTGLQLEPDEDV